VLQNTSIFFARRYGDFIFWRARALRGGSVDSGVHAYFVRDRQNRTRGKMLLYYVVFRRSPAAAGWHGKCSSLLNGRTGDLKLERSQCDLAAADYGRR
jgi:hypothetical protein